MIRIAILASGSGSNAENITTYFSENKHVIIDCIVSNKPDAYVHRRAKSLGVASFTFPKEDFADGEKVADFLRDRRINFIVLAGFLLKIPQKLLADYPNRIVNIHPALLPKYGGKGMYGDRVHQAVVEAGETESGVTIHYVNENYDEGSIIFQAKCELTPDDTPEDVARKVHALEYEYFPKVIERLLSANNS
ncbi:MAG: phosphoribosylglycinamide formyltransferase [Prevotella sp.]|jgi:phosphoribosylglycinamide formyltransferase-1|nr:phosphoribosylglycinamide formyltransferase [Prevotella sp.]